MAASNGEATPASSATTPGRAAPYNENPIQVHNLQGTLVDVPLDLRGTPQLFLSIPCELMATSLPNGGINETPQSLFFVQSGPCYFELAAYEQFQLDAPFAYGEMEMGDQTFTAVPVILAAGQGKPQTLTPTSVDQAPMLARVSPAIPFQLMGASYAPAVPLSPILVSAGADAEPQTQVMTLVGTPAAQATKPSEWTVNEVAEFIRQIPGCARYVQVFRAHQIDGGALLRLCKHRLISVMNISLGAAVKIRSAIKSLQRKEKDGSFDPQ
ncbi:hypothetical protein HPB49_004499 [Dermacentor silvarum]|uniref:Uncharacterized protein n=1 Tax=Dermacentor silvarum TaxID=543639 RepID=A0ACB8DVI6_DERSI|nr:hypothetical protein HPB49_004499 [Dermacentor silvarum]